MCHSRPRPLLEAARTFLYLRGAAANPRLLPSGIGAASQHLRASAKVCGLTLPARHSWEQLWLRRAAARWVGSGMHGTEEPAG